MCDSLLSSSAYKPPLDKFTSGPHGFMQIESGARRLYHAQSDRAIVMYHDSECTPVWLLRSVPLIVSIEWDCRNCAIGSDSRPRTVLQIRLGLSHDFPGGVAYDLI